MQQGFDMPSGEYTKLTGIVVSDVARGRWADLTSETEEDAAVAFDCRERATASVVVESDVGIHGNLYSHQEALGPTSGIDPPILGESTITPPGSTGYQPYISSACA